MRRLRRLCANNGNASLPSIVFSWSADLLVERTSAHAGTPRAIERLVDFMATLNRVRTSVLEIAYEESGPLDRLPVLLMHGWPYDARAFDEIIPHLTAAGLRVIVPYLRGYGPTRF